MSKHQLIYTADGSKSLYLPGLDETYHSRHGAIQESQHVFIENGLNPLLGKFSQLNVLEVGFGTGLNVLLSIIACAGNQAKINFRSIEKYPISPLLANQMCYHEILEAIDLQLIDRIHSSNWQQEVALAPNFTLSKDGVDLDECSLYDWADLVYYDAFGPRVQPNMWNHQKLSIVHRAMRTGGIFVTYCAQGQFKRVLKDLGFEVQRLPGPPGKREMTRAIKL